MSNRRLLSVLVASFLLVACGSEESGGGGGSAGGGGAGGGGAGGGGGGAGGGGGGGAADPGAGAGGPVIPAASPASTQAGPCESPGATEEAEGNDAHANATRIGAGQAVTGKIGRPDDEDWFVIETCGEKLLRIELTNAPATSSPVDFILEVKGADGEREIGSLADYDGDDGITQLSDVRYIEEAGRVFIRIADHGQNEHDSAHVYRLTVTGVEVPDAANEPNGNMNQDSNRALATALPMGAADAADSGGRGFIASHDDEDWWKFDVTGETLLQIELSNAPATRSDVDYRMEVFGPHGTDAVDEDVLYDGNEGITMLRLLVYAAEAGTYFVRVADHGDDDFDITAGYRITANAVPVPDADHEPNGNANDDTNRSLATPAPLGQAVPGFIASHRDVDWFKVEVPAAGQLKVDVATTATSTEVDYRVVLQSATGEELAAESDYDGSDGITRVHVEAAVTAPGTYYVIVQDHGDDDWDPQNGFTVTATQ